MEQHLEDPRIEALAFDYLHFYGNANTTVWSPRWYRSEVRILRNHDSGLGTEGPVFRGAGHGVARPLPARSAHGRDDLSLRLECAASEMNLKLTSSNSAITDGKKFSRIDAATWK